MRKQVALPKRMLELTCQRKIAYKTKAFAKMNADALAQKLGRKVNPYKCRHCKLYHIGKW